MTGAELTPGLTEVIVASIAAFGLVLAGWIQVRRTRKVEDTLGRREAPDDPTVVEMMRKLLAGQTAQDARLAGHDRELAEQRNRLAEHAERLAEHDDLHESHQQRLRELAEQLRHIGGSA